MAKALFIVLAAVLFVAALAEVEFDDDLETDVEFLKRDPYLQEYFEAEKRGRSLKKYKTCEMFGQSCYCSRRSNKIVFCGGVAGGENI
ncbi:uncharacterized protein LOC121424524 [Lytechinus variegatus]|uniref:uncharacterized protein LOC121424524 n=1 Tax=Lytechinus variegatus TaxID=7654 RepID=UPI001BB17DB3|nr:uncharacterized protein LOC121424524 [Lytechinus variegatus]